MSKSELKVTNEHLDLILRTARKLKVVAKENFSFVKPSIKNQYVLASCNILVLSVMAFRYCSSHSDASTQQKDKGFKKDLENQRCRDEDAEKGCSGNAGDENECSKKETTLQLEKEILKKEELEIVIFEKLIEMNKKVDLKNLVEKLEKNEMKNVLVKVIEQLKKRKRCLLKEKVTEMVEKDYFKTAAFIKFYDIVEQEYFEKGPLLEVFKKYFKKEAFVNIFEIEYLEKAAFVKVFELVVKEFLEKNAFANALEVLQIENLVKVFVEIETVFKKLGKEDFDNKCLETTKNLDLATEDLKIDVYIKVHELKERRHLKKVFRNLEKGEAANNLLIKILKHGICNSYIKEIGLVGVIDLFEKAELVKVLEETANILKEFKKEKSKKVD